MLQIFEDLVRIKSVLFFSPLLRLTIIVAIDEEGSLCANKIIVNNIVILFLSLSLFPYAFLSHLRSLFAALETSEVCV